MTMSDSSALRRMVVMKQRSQSGQVWPRQASVRASSFCQSGEDSGRASISARSPVSVVFSHCGDVVELVDLFEAVEERVVAQGVELVAAEVVAAALHVADLQRAEEGFEEGDVLEEELLLQVFGAGGDDDALLALAGEAQGGQKIGEGFAGAGAGFDDEVALVFEGGFDGSGHLVLAAAVLEGEGGAGEDAAGGEEIVKRGQAIRDGLAAGVIEMGSEVDIGTG